MKSEEDARELAVLTACGKVIEQEFASKLENPDWAGSPFDWIRRHSRIVVGSVGVRLFCAWCNTHGVLTNDPDNTKSSKKVGKVPVEIKFATLGTNGKFTFNQIRTTGYEELILFGVTPFEAYCWVLPRWQAVTLAKKQHGPETFMMSVNPEAPTLQMFGGPLSAALPRLRKLGERRC